MRYWITLAVLAVGCSHATPPAAVTTAPAPSPAAAPVGLDETAFDPNVKPCDDFYQYACGGWLARAEIPADKASYGRSTAIDDHNLVEERAILEAAARGEGTGPYADKLGALWSTCMDEPRLEQTTPGELAQQFARIEAVKDLPGLLHEVAREHLAVAHPLFQLTDEQDFKDATQVIGGLDRAMLGLPDRDYYLKNEGKFPELRRQYEKHVARILALAGEPEAQAQKDAAAVMRLETALATVSLPRAERRDPSKIYHRLELAGITKTAPKIDWKAYLTDVGVPDVTQINVSEPEYFIGLNKELQKSPLADWKSYLRWQTVHALAPLLSKPFVDENFAFYMHTLEGVAEIEPRWKRCVRSVDHVMGFALGEEFVRNAFGADGKARAQAMVREIEAAMAANLDTLGWMDAATRAQAREKLAHIANKIGYPDKWRDYEALVITKESSFAANFMRGNVFEQHRRLTRIGKPLDRTDWHMTPPTVNAYYNASLNEMVFPAGILQPPFFNRDAIRAINYGAIGMVMGHELTHGFDDHGREFDARGDLRDWWTPSVGQEFARRAQCLVDQYSGYVPVDNLRLNGKLTLGENIADLGGIKLAYAAYVAGRGGPSQRIGKFTDDQLFFIGTAQAWCRKQRPELLRMRVTTDTHSATEFRIIGPMSNMPEFAAAFSCQPTDKMVRANRCAVW
jgi:endothelin-converting enzyme/putative endopeptidase